MGLSNSNSGGNVTFAYLHNGRFKVKTDENNPKAVHRVNNKGNDVYELSYGELTGFLTAIRFKEVPFEPGKVVEFEVTDRQGERTQVGLPFYKRQATDLLKRLPNLNEEEEVQFKVFLGDEQTNSRGQKFQNQVFFFQQRNEQGEWSTVPMKWTKENPGKLPQWTKTTVQGKDTYDNTDQFHYLVENVIPWFSSKIDKVTFPIESKPSEEPEIVTDDDMENEPDVHDDVRPQDAPASGGKLPGEDEIDDDLPF